MPVAEPIAPQPSPPAAVTTQSWLHLDRKVLSGGLGGLAALAIIGTASHFGYDLQPIADSLLGVGTVNVLAVLTLAFSFAMAYLVPSSVADVLSKLNLRIMALAVIDDTNPQLANVTINTLAKEAAKVVVAENAPPADNSGNANFGPRL